jgi:ABC-type multidrug transport system ATPase subunit
MGSMKNSFEQLSRQRASVVACPPAEPPSTLEAPTIPMVDSAPWPRELRACTADGSTPAPPGRRHLALEFNGIDKAFKGRRRINTVFHDFSLTLPLDRVVLLFGKNGSGKSTLLRMIAGLVTPDAGTIEFREGVLRHPLSDRFLSILHGGAGAGTLYAKMTVLENIAYFSGISGYRRLPARLDLLLRRFGLREQKDELVETLSRGTRQKALLVRSLACEAGMVLLDEPTEYLDDDAVRALIETIDEVAASGVSFVIATHDARLATLAHCLVHTLVSPDGDASLR